MSGINLICIPFAGGNRYSYRPWLDKMPAYINIIPLEFPGRGGRSDESLLTDMDSVVDDLYARIRQYFKDGSYAIHGHSMGGIVAYLLTRKILGNGEPGPVHLFVTGTSAPSASTRAERKFHLLGKYEFTRIIESLEGCPPGIFENEDMIDYLEPILRADYMVAETYRHDRSSSLNIPLTVITGREENLGPEEVLPWAEESGKTDFITLPGGHFFIFSSAKELIEILSQKLLMYNEIAKSGREDGLSETQYSH
jgi:surfactin synthase thioesterase subunit